MKENCQHEQIAAPVLQMGPFAVLSDAAPPLMMTKNPLKGSRFVQAANYNVVFMYFLYNGTQCIKTLEITQFNFLGCDYLIQKSSSCAFIPKS